ncbi:uncharacterized protein LOC133711390 [Rosa rugosa]|uniref:uncharacterized protein LOC133711390 n=1 Tax=Rosa rugosa TaxID=74645 RepID=UPI002B405662|nr:uncharacterized protein LOC133711390 [Rosa rugosa]
MRKGVQMLELDFSAYTGLFDEKYIFSNKLLGISVTSALKSLCSEYIDFKCLEVLDLKTVNVDQEVLEYFLSNCSLLERLIVYASSSFVNLRVVGQSIALKYLGIEICDANLVSFIYEGDLRNLLFRNLRLLVEVYFLERLRHDVLEIAFRSFSFCLSQLEIILKLNCTIVWLERDFVIPLLPNLKRLELAFDEDEDCALLHLISFIKESPCLHTLVLLVKLQVIAIYV